MQKPGGNAIVFRIVPSCLISTGRCHSRAIRLLLTCGDLMLHRKLRAQNEEWFAPQGPLPFQAAREARRSASEPHIWCFLAWHLRKHNLPFLDVHGSLGRQQQNVGRGMVCFRRRDVYSTAYSMRLFFRGTDVRRMRSRQLSSSSPA